MPGIPCTIYTAAMKLYKLETSLFVGREVKYDFHSDQNKTKNNKKIIIYYYQFGSKKKKEERISVVKWVRTSLYGDYVADFAGTGNLLNGRHKIFPSETFQCCSSQTLMFLFHIV